MIEQKDTENNDKLQPGIQEPGLPADASSEVDEIRAATPNQIFFIEGEMLVNDHPVFQHPFLNEFGKLSPEGLKKFIAEQYHLSVSLPQALAATYAQVKDAYPDGKKVPAWKIGLPLMQFLGYEHWGSTQDGNHSSHFLSLAAALGLDIKDLEAHEPLASTKEFTDSRIALCLEGPLSRALGALAFANEYSNVAIFNRYRSGVLEIVQRHGIELPLDYFNSHVDEEPEDYHLFKNMMEQYCTPGNDQQKFKEEALAGAKALLDARQKWYDDLLKATAPAQQ